MTYTRIDNGYKQKPSYLASNGMMIHCDADTPKGLPAYYIEDTGKQFFTLKESKTFCETNGGNNK